MNCSSSVDLPYSNTIIFLHSRSLIQNSMFLWSKSLVQWRMEVPKSSHLYIFIILQLCQGASSLWCDQLRHSFPSWKCLCLIYSVYTELMMNLLAPSQSTIERLGLLARFLWMLTLNAFFYSFCINFYTKSKEKF